MSKYKDYISDLATTFEYLNNKIVAQRNHTTNMGFHKKKCKSCRNFINCQKALNRSPMHDACREYIKKKK